MEMNFICVRKNKTTNELGKVQETEKIIATFAEKEDADCFANAHPALGDVTVCSKKDLLKMYKEKVV